MTDRYHQEPRHAPVRAARTLTAALCGLALATAPEPADAAADKTRGMAIMSARVAADGTLVRGHGVVNAGRTSLGEYELTMSRAFTDDCTFAGTSVPQVTVHFLFAVDGKLRLNVTVPGSGSIDRDFQALIFCAR